jgi:hypothetical protein
MSFLDSNSSEYLSARITKKGRNAIAKGDFDISYFLIGDSEFDYNSPFNNLTGSTTTTGYQNIFAPLDGDSNVKYPFVLSDGATIYGLPMNNNQTTTLRNAIGPAGFISNNIPVTGATIECFTGQTATIDFSSLTGTDLITVTKPADSTFINCEYISLVLGGIDESLTKDTITGRTNSLVYKILGVTGSTTGTTQTIQLDRPTPVLSIIPSGHANVICNNCDVEFGTTDVDNTQCIPQLPDNDAQHNPWTVNLVYSRSPIGISETDLSIRSLSGYTSNKYIGVKEFLGYSSTGQTFTDSTGNILSNPISYVNSYEQEIIIDSTEQRAIAIIHYSEVGDIVNDPDRFFKYDDYISHSTGTTNTVATNFSGGTVSDTDYFEVYIPFLQYHRNSGSTIGAVFYMGNSDKYLVSSINTNMSLKYRDLVDEYDNKVGKVFVTKKIVVIDDSEIVTVLDYKSNRRHTLPAPKLSLIPPTGATQLISGTTSEVNITYVLEYTGDTKLNNLPCSYLSKIEGTSNPSNLTFSFGNQFTFLQTSTSGLKDGFIANKFYALVQTGATTGNTVNMNWKKIDMTTLAGGDGSSLLTSTNLTGKTFTITKEMYDSASTFNLQTHFSSLSMTFTGNTSPYFGDEQPFAGSVKLVRAYDIEEMNFMVNLPSGNFSTSQNPTCQSCTPMITEVALLNSKKDTMVIAKTSKPIKREGTQVFAIRLDF